MIYNYFVHTDEYIKVKISDWITCVFNDVIHAFSTETKFIVRG